MFLAVSAGQRPSRRGTSRRTNSSCSPTRMSRVSAGGSRQPQPASSTFSLRAVASILEVAGPSLPGWLHQRIGRRVARCTWKSGLHLPAPHQPCRSSARVRAGSRSAGGARQAAAGTARTASAAATPKRLPAV
uniref:Uncharacterized protein n=1 Tax=Macrostomum lignano TaxID=282301 RepID=A0A1I8F5P4_9PLAT